ncbi:hypothetical protein ACNKHQ_07495 [Shigella flexneri]
MIRAQRYGGIDHITRQVWCESLNNDQHIATQEGAATEANFGGAVAENTSHPA